METQEGDYTNRSIDWSNAHKVVSRPFGVPAPRCEKSMESKPSCKILCNLHLCASKSVHRSRHIDQRNVHRLQRTNYPLPCAYSTLWIMARTVRYFAIRIFARPKCPRKSSYISDDRPQTSHNETTFTLRIPNSIDYGPKYSRFCNLALECLENDHVSSRIDWKNAHRD